jgi:hypothetical protein
MAAKVGSGKLLLDLASKVILGSESRRARDQIFCLTTVGVMPLNPVSSLDSESVVK